ncbi:Cytochrome P450 [Quillaja saponaria]|uniref:Cytochrome P450 n=1 Tax=Quillaja saponaria TaxID=32244 RepID=A0AAD7VNF2_QUISA|nr:Cytochrome P450 [Quillaja saponaria]
MEVSFSTSTIGIWVLIVTVLVGAWRVLNWLWLKPKKLERLLRQQGLKGNSYRILFGDMKQSIQMLKEAKCKPMNLSDDCHDIAPRVFPFLHQIVKNYGKNCFIWVGPIPRLTIMDPEQIKEIFTRVYDFQKLDMNPLAKLLVTGLANYNGEKWTKHRKIINPAFHMEKLKLMLPTFCQSCDDMIRKWEGLVSSDGSCELDVWPSLQSMTSDVISRTAFGSSYEEGRRIFQLLNEQIKLALKSIQSVYIPGWRFLPTGTNQRMKEIDRDIRASLKDIIDKREKAIKAGEATNDDLLSILLESNYKEIQEHGNNKNVGMSIRDVIEECKLFYLGGQETTSLWLVWTMVLLSRHPDWQASARKEVVQIFGNQKPDYDRLSHLKIVTMILFEVLRLYPPAFTLARAVNRETKLGNLILPAGVQVCLPTILVQHDRELWGDDAIEFKPERFSEGVSKATKSQVSFFPFGWGPRICIGQNFGILEAKMALSLMLQRFSFELSPTYAHAPSNAIPMLQPQHGVHLILRKL